MSFAPSCHRLDIDYNSLLSIFYYLAYGRIMPFIVVDVMTDLDFIYQSISILILLLFLQPSISSWLISCRTIQLSIDAVLLLTLVLNHFHNLLGSCSTDGSGSSSNQSRIRLGATCLCHTFVYSSMYLYIYYLTSSY